ncbi:hypothetical protein [Desemzia sp. FAM 23990]
MNNKIKVLNRVGYGYRNLINYKIHQINRYKVKLKW